ncbi:subunit of tubulin prefoldin [Amphichorda felina]
MSGQGETVNLDTLAPEQLAQVKKQLDEELEHLTQSFSQLHGAQNKFKDCLRTVQSRKNASPGPRRALHRPELGPRPPDEFALRARQIGEYGPGARRCGHGLSGREGKATFSNSSLLGGGGGTDRIEQDLTSAAKFYDAKVTELNNNLKDLETIIQRKQTNARTIEEVLRQKIMASQAQAAQAQQA